MNKISSIVYIYEIMEQSNNLLLKYWDSMSSMWHNSNSVRKKETIELPQFLLYTNLFGLIVCDSRVYFV